MTERFPTIDCEELLAVCTEQGGTTKINKLRIPILVKIFPEVFYVENIEYPGAVLEAIEKQKSSMLPWKIRELTLYKLYKMHCIER